MATGGSYFTQEERQKIMEDLNKELKDLYRIWLEEKNLKISVESEVRKHPKIGVIEYELLTGAEFFKKLQKAILYLNINPHIKITSESIYSSIYEIEEVSPDMLNSYIALKRIMRYQQFLLQERLLQLIHTKIGL